eukprot:GHRR01030001.1.p1 GENE.GHRR01030001.1~~GHRR01030001.1.p1  ORF type:complete len:117 (+),score=33.94 GHRR01030001.1:127-477(+)
MQIDCNMDSKIAASKQLQMSDTKLQLLHQHYPCILHTAHSCFVLWLASQPGYFKIPIKFSDAGVAVCHGLQLFDVESCQAAAGHVNYQSCSHSPSANQAHNCSSSNSSCKHEATPA